MTAAVFIAAAVMVISLLLSGCRAIGKTLVLRNADTGEVYFELPAADGDEFSVTFTHSVNCTDVTETYEIRDGGIYLTGCIYYDFGAGVATEMEDCWELSYGQNGEMIITGIDRKMTNLVYVVGTVSDHILEAQGEKYSLREMCGRNTDVAFEIK